MKLKTQLFYGYCLVFLLMIIIAIISYRGINSLLETTKWVVHTEEVIGEAKYLEKLLVDMETGQRGFVITGDEEFLEPYNHAKEEYKVKINALKELVKDNPAQVKRLNTINKLHNKWVKLVGDSEIEARKSLSKNSQSSIESIIARIKKKTGKNIVDKLRGEISEFVEVEEALLIKRNTSSDDIAKLNLFFVLFGTLLAIVIGIVTMVIVSRSVYKQVGGEPTEILEITKRIAQGNLDYNFDDKPTTGILTSVKKMLVVLRSNSKKTEEKDWIKTGIVQLNSIMTGEMDLSKLSNNIINYISKYINAQIGSLYILEEDGLTLKICGAYAFSE